MNARKHHLPAPLLILLLVLALAGSAAAGGAQPRHDFTESNPPQAVADDYAIVILKDAPAARYTGGVPGLQRTKPARGEKLNAADPHVKAYVDHLDQGHRDFRSYLASKAPQAEVVREFFYSFNGFAIRLNGARPETLSQGPGVRGVTASWLYRPTMNVSKELIDAHQLWPLVGGQAEAGAGIKVGIIDSGIDDSHPFFACKDSIPHKVYASGVAYDPSNVLVFDHGTHVAGTVAGCLTELSGTISGTISGVAPGAELYDYNVFPGFGAGYVAYGGSAFSHDIIAALEDAVLDGMDVVNMSLGGGVQGPHDALAEAVDGTVDAGVVAAVAAGNSGPGGMTVQSPGSAPNALTAGASTNPHFIGIAVTPDSGETIGAALGDFNNFVPPLSNAAYTTVTPADGCAALAEDLSGKIALIDRGSCTFTTKVRHAEAAGASGVLVVNNVAGDPVAMGHDGSEPFPTIPAAMLGLAEGTALKPSGTVSIDGSTPREFISNNSDIIAGFSSRGPTPYTYLIKPDITAPGVNVYSSVFGGEYAMFQGTSMATPHVAGSAALLLALHPDWSPDDVKSALANTAKRPVYDHQRGIEATGALTRGGGRIDLDAAHATPLTIAPASASFGLYNGNKAAATSLELLVRNVSDGPRSCTLSLTGPAIVSASSTSLALAAGESTALTLTLSGGKADKLPSGDYEGDAVLDCGESTLNVPWWVRIDRQGKP